MLFNLYILLYMYILGLNYIKILLIIILLIGIGGVYLLIIPNSPLKSQGVINENNGSHTHIGEGGSENNTSYYPCGEGYFLLGDICEPAPEGYIETRTPCEIGVDSLEAAGVEQDYLAELARCREEEKN